MMLCNFIIFVWHNMDITKIDLEEGEEMLVLHLTKKVAEKYHNILKTRNLTAAQFFIGALSLYETFTEIS
jgi:hypothetical protein